MSDLMRSKIKLLVCPTCRIQLELNKDRVNCPKCREEYPILNNIPIFIKKDGNEVPEKL